MSKKTDSATDTVPVRRAALEALIDAVKRTIRRHGGPATNGWAELAEALKAVVRDAASADLEAELERPMPGPVPVEEGG